MIIHVVQPGETINAIAEQYDITPERLISDNDIQSPNNLVVGETLVIVYPEQVYAVREGDTLSGIAEAHGVSVMQLLRNNPRLSDQRYIYPGEEIIISYTDDKIMAISTNGYAYPFIDRQLLRKTLPFLTYLTIYSYSFTADAEIVDINDMDIIALSKQYGVAPVMMLTALSVNQTEEINIIHSILISEEKQELFIENVIAILRRKGFYGVNINTPYLYPQDRDSYLAFITRFTDRVTKEGYQIFITLSLSPFEIMTDTIYSRLEYARLAQLVAGTVFISYDWGYSIGMPSGSIAFSSIRNLLEYMASQISPELITFGIPSIGYVWTLPYEPGFSRGQAISYNSVLELARDLGVAIQYDDITKSSYFQYTLGDEYFVQFKDARSIEAYTGLVPELGLNGIGIWNIMYFFAQMWLVINSQYDIEKLPL